MRNRCSIQTIGMFASCWTLPWLTNNDFAIHKRNWRRRIYTPIGCLLSLRASRDHVCFRNGHMARVAPIPWSLGENSTRKPLLLRHNSFITTLKHTTWISVFQKNHREWRSLPEKRAVTTVCLRNWNFLERRHIQATMLRINRPAKRKTWNPFPHSAKHQKST